MSSESALLLRFKAHSEQCGYSGHTVGMNVSALRDFLGYLKERDITTEAVRPSDVAFFVHMCLRKFRTRFHRVGLQISSAPVRSRRNCEAADSIAKANHPTCVSPHNCRQQDRDPIVASVHLVAAGVDVTVIRSWLGHAHLDTTNHYAQANLETKRKALEQVDPSLRSSRPPRWKRDTDLLAWLDSL
jgi:site-specific recombinase XerC